MSRFALADALTDFGAPPVHPVDPFPVAATAQPVDFPLEPAPPAIEPVDIDALIAEAVEQAQAALEQRLGDEHAAALAAAQAHHAEELAALERKFAEEASEKIVARFAEMESQIIELTSAVTARILGATLTNDIRDRSLERLAGLIREALADGEAVRIRLHGSLPLFEALKERLPDHCDQLDFMERPDFDLSLSIDNSVYETRLAEWSHALAETLA